VFGKSNIAAIIFALFASCIIYAESPPADKSKTLAVLEFDNQSAQGEWQWLAKGLSDMLITDLSASYRLQVVDRDNISEIMRELELGKTGLIDAQGANRVGGIVKADWVLFGAFKKEGNRLTLLAQLSDVETKKLLRVEKVEGLAGDIFKLEKELVKKVLENLDVPLSDEERRSVEAITQILSLPSSIIHAGSGHSTTATGTGLLWRRG
jgi:TolB-like protein